MVDKELCPLCKRDLGTLWDKHHLVPKSLNGKKTKTIKIHRICHNKIHSVLTEKELSKEYNTIEKLLEHKEIKKFINWVRKKEPDFYQKTRQVNYLKKR